MIINSSIDAVCPNCGATNEIALYKLYMADSDFNGLWSDMGGLRKSWTLCGSCESRFEVRDSVVVKELAALMDEVIHKVNAMAHSLEKLEQK